MMYAVGIYFVSSSVQSSLVSTGAFEVMIDNELVFSKLQSGGMLTTQQFAELFRSYGIGI